MYICQEIISLKPHTLSLPIYRFTQTSCQDVHRQNAKFLFYILQDRFFNTLLYSIQDQENEIYETGQSQERTQKVFSWFVYKVNPVCGRGSIEEFHYNKPVFPCSSHLKTLPNLKMQFLLLRKSLLKERIIDY